MVMAIKKNVPLCDDGKMREKNFEIFFSSYNLKHFFLRAKISRFNAGSFMLSETRREEKVGRVVSLSIDLQGISELDRDAVIASCKKREKDFVYDQRCITCAKVSS
jgi:hypothetical protein